MRVQKLINDELGFTIMPAAGHKKIDETAAFPYVPRMNISDQISAHWAAHQEESGRVWTLLPNQREPQTAAPSSAENSQQLARTASHSGNFR